MSALLFKLVKLAEGLGDFLKSSLRKRGKCCTVVSCVFDAVQEIESKAFALSYIFSLGFSDRVLKLSRLSLNLPSSYLSLLECYNYRLVPLRHTQLMIQI